MRLTLYRQKRSPYWYVRGSYGGRTINKTTTHPTAQSGMPYFTQVGRTHARLLAHIERRKH